MSCSEFLYLIKSVPLATAADHSARRARERRPDHQSEDPVRPLSSSGWAPERLPGGLAPSRTPMLAAWLGAVTMETTGLMRVRG